MRGLDDMVVDHPDRHSYRRATDEYGRIGYWHVQVSPSQACGFVRWEEAGEDVCFDEAKRTADALPVIGGPITIGQFLTGKAKPCSKCEP